MTIRGLLLDVEGVLVADKRYQAVHEAVEFIHRVRQIPIPLSLITNNTTDSKEVLVERLQRAGFDFTPSEAYTCTGAAIKRLKSLGARRCLVLGSLELRQVFTGAGYEVVHESAVDAVVVGLDTELTYERLRLACDAVGRRGAAFLALHRNRVYTDAFGRLAPSVGAIVESIVYATQVQPTCIGKPSADYFLEALAGIQAPRSEVLVVSDDPLTDLVGAKPMGMQTAFVLTGKYTDRTVLQQLSAAQQPDIVIESLLDLFTTGAVQS